MKDEYFDEIIDSDMNLFLAKNKSKIWVDTQEEEVVLDFSWVNKVEECLPYIDRIVRNPRKFLIQEEEVVIVEKAKKTTPETIRHLSQHTNLIQDIDEDDMIKPSKVLNVNKEDTVDIYENRFIYSLLLKLNTFVRAQLELLNENGSYYKCDRKTVYEADTKLKYENVKINLTIESNKYHDLPITEDGEKTIRERLSDIEKSLTGFMVTPFVKSLKSVLLVKSPIRKTNVILKEQNFKKALELWEYIESCELEKPKITKNSNTVTDNEGIRERFDFGYFIDYNALTMLDKEFIEKKKLFNTAYIKNLIEEYLNEVGGSEKAFTKLLKDQFKIVLKRRRKREAEVKKIYNKFIKTEEENFEKCELFLK